MNPTAEEAHYCLNGEYYKFGLRGMAFRWNGAEWIRTTTPPSQIRRGNAIHGSNPS